MAGNPKAKAAMRLARSAGISLKAAWARVKGGARSTGRGAHRTVRKVRRRAAGAARKAVSHVQGKDVVGGIVKKGFKIATNPWKVGGLLIAGTEYGLFDSYKSVAEGATTWGDEAQAIARRLPFGADSASATGTGSRFWNVVLGNGGLYVARKLFTAFFR